MTALGPGSTHEQRSISHPQYLSTADPGRGGGGTYNTLSQNNAGDSTEHMLQQYENIFGPAARDIKFDSQRDKRRQRWHLPDVLKGPNDYLTTRVDGLITDATKSPYTGYILPYKEKTDPDAKFKWNVYLFDEGLASRVPYESAARVLPQSKRSFAGYVVRQGLAIAMEHNFMASAAGRENFKNQLQQLVGSVQLTNDLDVHVALLHAPSYQKQMDEKFYDQHKTVAKTAREYVDLFGIMQKIPNALDFLIEDAKNHMQTWGSKDPNFLLCNGALTAQLTMLPELTNYMTNGEQGRARLASGPDLASYRGLKIINTRKFSMESGTAPRDLLRRRVRVAEYYRIPWDPKNVRRSYEFYDQSRDTMFRLSWRELVEMSKMSGGSDEGDGWSYDNGFWSSGPQWPEEAKIFALKDATNKYPSPHTAKYVIYKRGSRDGSGNTEDYRYEIHDGTIQKNVLKMPQRLVSKKYELVPTSDNNLIVKANDLTSNSVASLSDYPPYQKYRHLHIYSEVYGGGIFSDFTTSEAKDKTDGMVQFLNWNQLDGEVYETDETAQGAYYKNTSAYFKNLCRNEPLIETMEKYAAGKGSNYDAFTFKSSGEMDGSGLGVVGTLGTYLLKIGGDYTPSGYRAYLKTIGRKGIDKSNLADLDDQKMIILANAQTQVTTKQHAEYAALWALKLYVNAMRALIADCMDYSTNVSHALRECRFDEIKFAIQAACLQQAKNQFIYSGSTIEKAPAASGTTDWVTKHIAALGVVNGNKDYMLADLNPHAKNAVNLILQPNMHLDRTAPVKSGDMAESATSVRPCVWMLQTMLANMHLDEEVCERLLANGTELNKDEYKEFLKCDKSKTSKCTDWTWNTNLMHWFMSVMHSQQTVREVAERECAMKDINKRKLVLAIADAITNNTKSDETVKDCLLQLLKSNAASGDCVFSTDVASSTFGAYQRDSAQGLTIKNIPIEYVPSQLTDRLDGLFHQGQFMFRGHGKRDCLRYCSVADKSVCLAKPWFDVSVEPHVQDAQHWIRDPANMEEVLQHFVLILAKRFFKPSSKFMWNGTGMPVVVKNDLRYYPDAPFGTNGDPVGMPGSDSYHLIGEHLLHGPHVATHEAEVSVPGGAQDLLIMRPNIEHEMLGIIMGRGGDGELGATFWGQV